MENPLTTNNAAQNNTNFKQNCGEGLNRILKILNKAQSPVEELKKIVSIIGELFMADRCYVFKSNVSQRETDELTVSQVAEWVRGSIPAQINNQELQELPVAHFSAAYNKVIEGQIFSASVSELTDDDFKTLMESQDIKSFIFSPIINNETIWGFIGLDSCKLDRAWVLEEKLMLSNFSHVIGTAINVKNLTNLIVKKDQQLEVAIESSNDGFWYINLLENKVYLSKQWKSMLGYQEDELINSFETIEALIHPDERDLVLSTMDPYLRANQGTFEYEYRMRHKTGSYLWILTQAYVKKDENGRPTTLVGTNIDISARVTYKRNIEEKEKEYSNLINAVHEVIFQTDSKGAFIFLNPAWEEITGFNAQQSLGTSSLDYIYPDDLVNAQEEVYIKSSPNSVLNKEFEIRSLVASGGYKWVEVYISLVFNAAGDVSGSYGTITNIHQRKMAEIAQRESEEKFRLMADTMSDVTSLHKTDGTCFYVSPSVQEMLGYDPKKVIGNTPYSIIHPDDQEDFYQNTHQPLLKGKIEKGISILRFLRKDKSVVWIETVTQAIKKGEKIESILCVSRDISERRQAELEMEKALQKEKELHELKSRFITMASHEFRTPLTSIKSSVELLEMYAEDFEEKLNGPFKKHFEKIITQIDRLSQLMNNILVVGKTEADRMRFEPEETNLTELINTILKRDYAPWEDGRSALLTVNGSPRLVFVDSNLMEHVLNNLLSNAFKYSKDKPSPEITLSFQTNQFKVSVKDYGIGIPDDEQDQLFESFFRAKNTINIEGTGLGLVIMKQFVEMHQGTIVVNSQEDQGTEVLIQIPYQS